MHFKQSRNTKFIVLIFFVSSLSVHEEKLYDAYQVWTLFYNCVFFVLFFVRIKRNPLRWLNEGLSLGSRLTFFFLFFLTTHPPPHNTHRRIIFILESKDAFEIKWIQVFCQNAEICQKKKKKTLCTRTECIFSILHSCLNIARWD